MPTATAPTTAVHADDVSALSDDVFICRVRGGDVGGFAELYRRHSPAARRAAAGLSCPGASADDLVSESFARVLKLMLSGGGPDRSFRAYVCTAVRNTATARARSDWRLDFPGDDEFDAGMPPADSAESDAVRAITAEAVRTVLETLPDRWRSVLWMLHAEGRPGAEVAGTLGVSATALTSLAFRARRKLRALLEPLVAVA